MGDGDVLRQQSARAFTRLRDRARGPRDPTRDAPATARSAPERPAVRGPVGAPFPPRSVQPPAGAALAGDPPVDDRDPEPARAAGPGAARCRSQPRAHPAPGTDP